MTEQEIRDKVKKGVGITIQELQFICNEYYEAGYKDAQEEWEDKDE